MGREPIRRPIRARLRYARFLIRPRALSGTSLELPFAAGCIVALGIALVAEVLTPDAVVDVVALLPLLAAVWLLSTRWAVVVGVIAIVVFLTAVTLEVGNRLTLMPVGSVALITAVVAGMYATALASVLSSIRHLRPTVVTQATPSTLNGIDGFRHGIRSLTRRELEVARLGAEGFTTPEIAGRLHIGVRTVESHLSSAYSKLRISSRAELIRMATRLGIPWA